MGLYRNRDGIVVDLPDEIAQSRGDEYTPVSPLEGVNIAEQGAQQALGEERGALGSLNAAATGAISSLSLGGSDYLLSKLLSDGQRERLAAEVNVNPGYRTAGEIGGIFLGGMAAPESLLAKSPSGLLSSAAAEAAESGTAHALGAFGVEGALQSAGSYLGHSAIEDTEVTAEGLSGALGTGFKFGVVGGGAVLGIEKGAIAARRLFSKAVDGSKDAVAATTSAWETQAKTLADANEANVNAARAELAAIQAQRSEAKIAQQRAKINLTAEQMRAGRVGPEAAVETPSAFSAADHAGPVAEPSLRPFETPEFKSAETVNLNIKPEPAARPYYETPEFKSAETVNLNIKPTSRAMTLADEAGLARQGARSAEEGVAAGRSGALKDMSLDDLKNLVNEPAINKQHLRLMDALQEFESAKKAFDDIYIPANKLGTLEADDVLEYMGKGGDFDAFEAAHRNPLEDLGPAEPYTPAWSEQDLRKHFAQQGDAAAIGNPNKTVNERIGTDAYENALQKAAEAATPEEAQLALKEAADLENKALSLRPNSAAKVADEAEKITNYERASAKLADALGDAAHPASQEFSDVFKKAADDAVRKTTDRMTRAIDDNEMFGPAKMSSKERVQYARERLGEANIAHEEVKIKETGAKQSFKEAQAAAKQSRDAMKAAKPAAGAASDAAGKLGVFELLSSGSGLPGIHDLPVIGPLLSLWLKYRAVKNMFGKAAGRIPATGNAKAAAMAAQTKERLARAVDKLLVKAQKGAVAGRKTFPQMAAVLGERIHDNGEPHLPASASMQEKAAARMREIADYVSTPGAIERDVRREMRDVTDPDLIAAAEKQRRTMFEYLASKMPKLPAQSPFSNTKWVPSPAAAMEFARILHITHDPVAAFEAAGAGNLLPAEAEALRGVYPRLYAIAQERLMSQTIGAKVKINMPYRMQTQMSLLWDVPLAPSLEPDNIRIVQSVYEPIPVAAPPPAGAPPTPSIAQPTNMTSLYQTASDRSALQR